MTIKKKSKEEMNQQVDIWDIACKSHSKLMPDIKDDIIRALLKGEDKVENHLKSPTNKTEEKILDSIITLIKQDLFYLGLKLTVEDGESVTKLIIPLEIKK